MAGNVSSAGEVVARLKGEARAAAEARRRSLSQQVVLEWGGEVQAHLTALPFLAGPGGVVAVYEAQSFEVPLSDFIAAAGARGMTCVFPRVAKGERVLSFHDMRGQDWASGPLGLRQPKASTPATPLEAIDVFIVPGAAFTRDGRRLGRGGGYYDATLARRRPSAITVGVCFDLNVVADLPTEPHDQRVDWLATERGAARMR
ncbi:MAG: 5-formyltetrahydrofolate cyclo-ligase [Myxococcaceae bacterium]